MEKKTEATLIDAFKDFKEEKNIDRPVMMGVLKDVFLTQIAKTYGSSDNFDVIINVDKGDCEIYQNFDVVEEVENPNTQITLEQIKEETGDDDYEIGDVYTKKLSLASFGRRGILNIRQNLQGRIMDIDKANVFKLYSDKVGEIFTGEIYQTWSKEVIILDEDSNELHLPKSEQIPGERFKKGDTLRAIIKSVEMKNNTTPYITLSRTSNEFLEKLFELEVPEIFDGLITIKKVVRIPGERAKVALARLMLSDTNLLILDEPTNHLDVFTLQALQELLAGYAGTALFVSHDRAFVEAVATRIVRFEGTKLIAFEGTLSQLEAERNRDRSAEDKQLQISALEMRLAALAARMAAPRKGDHPDQLNAEYAGIAERLRQLKHSD